MKYLLVLLLAILSASAAEDAAPENIYAVHSRTHKLIMLRGLVFRAHGDFFYANTFGKDRQFVSARRVIPGQAKTTAESKISLPYPHWSPGVPAAISCTRTHRSIDGGNIYIINDQREDNATEAEVKNMPEGYSISQSAAVPHEGTLLLILKESATEKCCFAFLDVATGMLDAKRYPGATTGHSLIWRGGNLVWQISYGRSLTGFDIYDLERGEYLVKDGTCESYYSDIVPMGRRLVGLKFNGDADIMTPLDEPQIAAAATPPRDTTLYGVPEQPGDTILCAPGKVFSATESAFYRRKGSYVYELRISDETHFMENPVFDATEYPGTHPGHTPYIFGRYTGEVALNGGDVLLMPANAAATSLRVKNLPSGYVIDACAAVPCGDKLALHLTHAAKGESAYALLNTTTAAIEGPLHPTPLSRPASLIQRNENIIWEIADANAWELPLTAYDLRTNKRVFEETIDSPRIICILGHTAAYTDIHDLLYIIHPTPSPSTSTN